MRRLALAAIAACSSPPQHDPVVWPVREQLASPIAAADDDAGVAPTSVELTASIVDAKLDNASGSTFVTISAGANHGLTTAWTGAILDANGATLGRFTIVEVKPRSALGVTQLAPKQLDKTRVRLTSP